MESNPAIDLASAIQSASINRAPSPSHDLNPSTVASEKIPVKVAPSTSYSYDGSELEDGIEIDEDDEEIPYEVLRPIPRRASFGPLPDLRFEQSYLASIAGAETRSKVAWITIRDQVLLPLLQGTIWSLALHGWRHWNRNAQLSGQSVGAKVRRWWYRTNNWKLPNMRRLARDKKSAAEVADVSRARSGLGGVPCFTDVM